ncbi:hypothetical protein [Pseudomonas putida]|uniref:Uncharacterized protein n=1 Tax=Pseudomonas putida TaxID=303 RepID=A0A1Q9R5U7_PSEPU|nr:hypothetical protein [Pseudomonas putida]OLS62672.1 hypothetical protein PSEMO_24350 [Pseudomonas putida]
MTITLHNITDFDAEYFVRKGQLIIAHLPATTPNASLSVPTDNLYEVIATTLIEGNTYTSAPFLVSDSQDFLAQVRQERVQGTYVFDVVPHSSSVPDRLVFQKTCLSPVTFVLRKDGKPLQSVVVHSSTESQLQDISNTVHIYAVINGVTTATLTTNNPNATITATNDRSNLQAGYYALIES